VQGPVDPRQRNGESFQSGCAFGRAGETVLAIDEANDGVDEGTGCMNARNSAHAVVIDWSRPPVA
jgi:hypothetical protein